MEGKEGSKVTEADKYWYVSRGEMLSSTISYLSQGRVKFSFYFAEGKAHLVCVAGEEGEIIMDIHHLTEEDIPLIWWDLIREVYKRVYTYLDFDVALRFLKEVKTPFEVDEDGSVTVIPYKDNSVYITIQKRMEKNDYRLTIKEMVVEDVTRQDGFGHDYYDQNSLGVNVKKRTFLNFDRMLAFLEHYYKVEVERRVK